MIFYPSVSETAVHNALRLIITNKESKALNYCITYAQAGLTMSGHNLYVQCLYILNNMTHWRGDIAKEVRLTLKTFVKQGNCS